MTVKKNILILCNSDFTRQPRVLRTIEALSGDYAIRVYGQGHVINGVAEVIIAEPAEQKRYWHFNKPALIRLPVSFFIKYIVQRSFSFSLKTEHDYWNSARKKDLQKLAGTKSDLIICHGTDTLPLAVKLSAGKKPVIFNAHEYYPLEFEQDAHWLANEGRRNVLFLRKYLSHVNTMFSVSNGIREKYLKEFSKDSLVITNAAPFQQLSPRPVNKDKIRIVHHGIANREREIEKMAELIDLLPNNYELSFVLTEGNPGYLDELKKQFASNPRIHFLPAVPMSELYAFLNNFDIGYYILPPVNFNTTYALPNKFFEFVQARLCLVFAPLVETAQIIKDHRLGIVSEDFTVQSVAAAINKLSAEDIFRYKQNADQAAGELSAESNQNKIAQLVKKIILN